MNLKIRFDPEKDLLIKRIREVSFRQAINLLENEENILDDIEHPNRQKFSHQRMLIMKIEDYVYAIPYVINLKNKEIFLKTIYPSRKYTRIYLNKK